MANYLLNINGDHMQLTDIDNDRTIIKIQIDDLKFDDDHKHDFEMCMKDFILGLLISKKAQSED